MKNRWLEKKESLTEAFPASSESIQRVEIIFSSVTATATDPMGQAKSGGLGHRTLSNKTHISTTQAGTPNDLPVYETAGDNTHHLISHIPPPICHGTSTYKWQLSTKFTLVTLTLQSQNGCCLLGLRILFGMDGHARIIAGLSGFRSK